MGLLMLIPKRAISLRHWGCGCQDPLHILLHLGWMCLFHLQHWWQLEGIDHAVGFGLLMHQDSFLIAARCCLDPIVLLHCRTLLSLEWARDSGIDSSAKTGRKV